MKTWKISLLLSYISIASISAAIITPALPQIQSSLGISQGSLEWIVSIFLIGYMLGQLFYGPLANRIGRLGALRLGFSINLVGIVCCLLACHFNNYHFLLLGRFITALGASAGLSCTFILLNESLSADKAKHALSYAVVMFTVGIGLAVLIGGLITRYFSWQDCFWFLLAHGILVLCSTALFSETLTQPQKTALLPLFKAYGQALCHRRLLVFALFVGLVSLFSYCYSVAAPIATHKLLKLSAAAYG